MGGAGGVNTLKNEKLSQGYLMYFNLVKIFIDVFFALEAFFDILLLH